MNRTAGQGRPVLSPSLSTRGQSKHSTATATGSVDLVHPGIAQAPQQLTRITTDTLSTESGLTAERGGTGSSPGSSTTWLTRPRIVVVHGAMSVRRCRGMTASRDRTTTVVSRSRPSCSTSTRPGQRRPPHAAPTRPVQARRQPAGLAAPPTAPGSPTRGRCVRRRARRHRGLPGRTGGRAATGRPDLRAAA
jgi:hypothetical protein